MNVTPSRFESKARDADYWYSIDCTNFLEPADTLEANVIWLSRPAGLAFTEASVEPNAAGQAGKVAKVKIGQGAEGQLYRVVFIARTVLTNEQVVPIVDDEAGIPLQIVGDPVSNQPAYRWWGSR